MNETDVTAAERESKECSRAADGENGERSGTEAEKALRVKRVEGLEQDGHTKEAVSEFCLSFDETYCVW